MYYRAIETGCLEQFLKMSRNKDEVCGNYNSDEGDWKIEESSIVLASGEHNLQYIKMNGRLQIDMYNYFRRDYNLPSYKLDYVSGYCIGDKVKTITYTDTKTLIKSKNLKGLRNGNYISFEEIVIQQTCIKMVKNLRFLM